MTLHSAKGLEFDTVHIAGCDEGILPSKAYEQEYSEVERKEKLEEERRLFYVGLTRAKKHLFLYTTQNRFWHGEQKTYSPSSFIEEMDNSAVYFERLSKPQSSPFTISLNKHKSAPRIYDDEYSQVEPALVGKFVRHNKFGKGKVVGQDGYGEETRLEILFADGITRKFVLKYTNLTFINS